MLNSIRRLLTLYAYQATKPSDMGREYSCRLLSSLPTVLRKLVFSEWIYRLFITSFCMQPGCWLRRVTSDASAWWSSTAWWFLADGSTISRCRLRANQFADSPHGGVCRWLRRRSVITRRRGARRATGIWDKVSSRHVCQKPRFIAAEYRRKERRSFWRYKLWL